MFQSLFLWIFRSYRLGRWHTYALPDCFNPCSYGSSVLTEKIRYYKSVYQIVSILVLMDLPFLPSVYMTKDEILKLFQSLFLWIFRSYEKSNFEKLPTGLSFNPCSYGSSVLTRWTITLCQAKRPVSILVLMDLPFLRRASANYRSYRR